MKNIFVFFILLIITNSIYGQESIKLTSYPPISYEIIKTSYDWREINQLKTDGLPRKTIEALKVLEEKALKENNYIEYWKILEEYGPLFQEAQYEGAITQKIVWEYAKQVELIKFPFNNILHYHLKNWLQELNWSGELASDDESLEWKINGKVAKIKNSDYKNLYTYHQLKSIENPTELMKISSEGFLKIDENYNRNQAHIYTLFDFLANRLLSDDEYDSNQPEQSDLTKEKLIFGSTADLLKIKTIKDSLHLNFQLMFQLETLSYKNNRWDAYAFWLHQRITKAENLYTLKDKDSLKINAYQNFEKILMEQPASSLFTLLLSEELISKGLNFHWKNNLVPKNNFVEALKKIDLSLTKFPKSNYSTELNNAKNSIVANSKLNAFLKSELTFNKSVILSVSYRNIEKAYLKIYYISKENKRKNQWTNHLKNLELKEVYSQNLTFQKDSLFQNRDKDFIIPAFKEQGNYLFILTDNEEKIEKLIHLDSVQNLTSYNFFISQISSIQVNTKSNSSFAEFLITDKITGLPINNALISISKENYNKKNPQFITSIKTNKIGIAQINLEKNDSYSYKVTKEKDSIQGNFYYYPNNTPEERNVLSIITDRAIYRPGQKVYTKVYGFSQLQKTDSLYPLKQVTLSLSDANGSSLFKKEVSLNEFGSGEVSFILPKSGFILGAAYFSISGFEGGLSNSKSIRIEEYKRPTFEVSFDVIKGKIKLGETIPISGNAKSFAGYPIAGAKVKIEINQKNYFPRWCSVGYSNLHISTFVEVKTDENGNYTFDFSPEKKANNYGSYFNFTAIVTDVSGEVHEASRSLYVGNNSYIIDAAIENNLFLNQQNTLPIRILNSESQEIDSLKVTYQLVKINNKNWLPFEVEKAEFQSFDKTTFKNSFPLTRYYDEQKEEHIKVVEKGTILSSNSLDLNKLIGKNTGTYSLITSIKDETGEIIESKTTFNWINPTSKKKQHTSEFWVLSTKKSAKIGDEVQFIIGSSYKKIPVYFELSNAQTTISKQWIALKYRKTIKHIITKEDLGGIMLTCSMSKHLSSHLETNFITVLDTSKNLKLKLESIRDFLEPGATERWNIRINNEKGVEKTAELTVGMYDASLDQFNRNQWERTFYSKEYSIENWGINSANNGFYKDVLNNWQDQFNFTSFNFENELHFRGGRVLSMSLQKNSVSSHSDDKLMRFTAPTVREEKKVFNPSETKPESTIEPLKPTSKPRTNFNETAFFYPSVYSDSIGNYRFEYTLPDALTRWKLMAMAHTKDLKSGYYEQLFEAKKEVMVEPNEPRFFREGDVFQFSTKVVNMSDKDQTFSVTLHLIDPLTNDKVTAAFGDIKEKKVTIPAKKSTDVSWKLTIPFNLYSLIAYEVSASNEFFSDVERKPLPILSNKMLVTTAKTFMKTAAGKESFTLDKINELSATAQKIAVTLEMHTQPLWTTLMSLPYLMEYPYEGAEQTFSRFFGNSIARKIIKENTDFQRIIETWKTTDPSAFLSELDKNQELKTLILNETPWVLDAQNEATQRQNLAFLFDENNLNQGINDSYLKLIKMKSSDGGWSWFGGNQSNIYITQYIIEGFQQLKEMGISIDPLSQSILHSANNFINNYYTTEYNKLTKEEKEKYVGLSDLHIHWLLTDDYNNESKAYYLNCIEKQWKQFNLQTQAYIGILALKLGKKTFAEKIKMSILDRATRSSTDGMYWKENKNSYYWNTAPIETQSTLIRFFDELKSMDKEIVQLQLWLLRNKQTNAWESTRATTSACFALMNSFSNTQKRQEVSIEFGDGTNLGILKNESASKFKYTGKEATNGKGTVNVTTTTDQPIFGAIYLQYLEPISNITKSTGDIRLERHYYTIENGKEVEVKPETILTIGAHLKVKLTVVNSQNLEFVHLKDSKAAGFEARETLSEYHYSKVGYFQISKDASTDFFIDNLPKGTYTFEYEVFVSAKGTLQIGAAEVECMYAPSFRANSGGFVFNVSSEK